MARKYKISEALYDYALNNSLKEPKITVELRDETFATERAARMVSSPEQMQFIALLLKLMQPKKCLEVGVFTGYSALWIALNIPENSKLIACEKNPRYEKIAKKYWQKGNVDKKIDLKIAPAMETLDTLIEQKQAETFDFIYIDADKLNYKQYFEKSLSLLKTGGLIIFDNVFLFGEVVIKDNVNPLLPDAMREFNDFINNDSRVDISILPLGDGMTLAYKR